MEMLLYETVHENINALGMLQRNAIGVSYRNKHGNYLKIHARCFQVFV